MPVGKRERRGREATLGQRLLVICFLGNDGRCWWKNEEFGRIMSRLEPIYRSDGEWVAVYENGHLFNVDGEWLGFVKGREVFDPGGVYLGFLSDDRRLLRSRSRPLDRPSQKVPRRPERPRISANAPLPPLLRALPFHTIDMFEEYPERLMYISETRPDME